MPKVKTWESEFHEMYIPVQCPTCGEKVSITGDIEGEEIKLSKCPSCGAEFEVSIEQDTGEEESENEEDALTEATQGIGFMLRIENMGLVKNATYELAGFNTILDGLVALIDVACLICTNPKFPPPKLKDMIIRTMLPRVYPLEGLKELVEQINEIIAKTESSRAEGN